MGETGDKYEQEADKVAAEVVQQISPPTPVSNVQGEVVQRAIEGSDPVKDFNISDPTYVNDLLYGLTDYRDVTIGESYRDNQELSLFFHRHSHRLVYG